MVCVVSCAFRGSRDYRGGRLIIVEYYFIGHENDGGESGRCLSSLLYWLCYRHFELSKAFYNYRSMPTTKCRG